MCRRSHIVYYVCLGLWRERERDSGGSIDPHVILSRTRRMFSHTSPFESCNAFFDSVMHFMAIRGEFSWRATCADNYCRETVRQLYGNVSLLFGAHMILLIIYIYTYSCVSAKIL